MPLISRMTMTMTILWEEAIIFHAAARITQRKTKTNPQ